MTTKQRQTTLAILQWRIQSTILRGGSQFFESMNGEMVFFFSIPWKGGSRKLTFLSIFLVGGQMSPLLDPALLFWNFSVVNAVIFCGVWKYLSCCPLLQRSVYNIMSYLLWRTTKCGLPVIYECLLLLVSLYYFGAVYFPCSKFFFLTLRQSTTIMWPTINSRQYHINSVVFFWFLNAPLDLFILFCNCL